MLPDTWGPNEPEKSKFNRQGRKERKENPFISAGSGIISPEWHGMIPFRFRV
jgi:hypothetical protein